MGHAKLDKPLADSVDLVAMPRNDWAPAHEVYLDEYEIDENKVNWARYRRCVDAGVCDREGLGRFPETARAFESGDAADQPASGITFFEAQRFCIWEGGRLPTEAEWERAARGPANADYPWGSAPPSEKSLTQIAFYQRERAPRNVHDDTDDVSAEGVRGLVSGEGEWVADWYSPISYAAGLKEGPTAPVFKTFIHEYGPGGTIVVSGTRTVRGWRGSAAGGVDWSRERGAASWFRDQRDPRSGATFRCARNTPVPPGDSSDPAVYRGIHWRVIRGSK